MKLLLISEGEEKDMPEETMYNIAISEYRKYLLDHLPKDSQVKTISMFGSCVRAELERLASLDDESFNTMIVYYPINERYFLLGCNNDQEQIDILRNRWREFFGLSMAEDDS